MGKTSGTANLASCIEEHLPVDLLDFIKKAGEVAEQQQQRLYLVGGVIRDLLMKRETIDLDMVVEGDAIKLAGLLADIYKAKVTPHPRFGTAKLAWAKRSADLATARAETYIRPGALPTVRTGTIKNDLARRDFTINAMAIELNPRHIWELIDPHGGRLDLEKHLVRILHGKSFIDDATRLWRAIRYEQRLNFKIEPATLALIKRNINMLSTVSGDRIRHELELVLKEDLPEKPLLRAEKLGVLKNLHPSLKVDDWLVETFERARERNLTDTIPHHLYLALLAFRLTNEETEELITYLRLPKTTAKILRDTAIIKGAATELTEHGMAPGAIYDILHGHSLTALEANSLATGSPTTAEHIELYLNVLRHVKPSLTGDDLKKLDIPEGPKIKDVLQLLREARLDGKVSNREDEEAMVRGLVVDSKG